MTQIRDKDLIEQEGIDYISAQVRRMKHVWRATSTRDVGIDGEIELFDEGGHATGQILKVQSKAGRSYIRNEKTDRFDYYGDANHISYWTRLINPVIVIIYDPTAQTAYWVDFKKYLKAHPEVQQPPYKIVFDKTRQFAANAASLLYSVFKDDDTEAETKYRNHVIEKHGKLTLYSVASDKPLAVDLERVFVRLKTVERRRQHPAHLLLSRSKAGTSPSPHLTTDQRVAAALNQASEEVAVTLSPGDALRTHEHLIILGAPGSGKTTLLKYLALTFSRAQSRERLSLAESRLPIFVALRDFSRFLDNLAARKELGDLGPQLLPHFLQEHFQNTAPHLNFPVGFFDRALSTGHCIVLLDGMDEVADSFKRARIAEEIAAVTQFYRANRFVLTSRPRGYEGEPKQRLSLLYADCTILDFDNDEMEAFAQSWYEAVTIDRISDTQESRAEARRQAKDLLRSIHADTRVRTLAPNPLLLSVLAMVHQRGVGLPQRRAELYEECIEMLLGYWDQTKGGESARDLAQLGELDREEKRVLLEPVALWFHERGEQGLEADRADLVEVIERQFLESGTHKSQAHRLAKRFLDLIEERAGLLVEREPGVFAFAHLTFQEYLAARALADRDDYIDYSLARLHDPWWREVILLEVAHLTGNHRLGRRARKLTSDLIRAILDAESWMEEVLRRDLLFAARCSCDTGKLGMDEALRRDIINRLLRALTDTIYEKQRSQIIEILIYALPTPEGEHIKSSLIEQSRSSNQSARQAIAAALESIVLVAPTIDVLRAVLLLRADLTSEPSSPVRWLYRASSVPLQPLLLDLIRDPAPNIRAEATKALFEDASSLGKDNSSVDFLKVRSAILPLLEDPSPLVRTALAEALSTYTIRRSFSSEEILSVLSPLAHDPDKDVQQAATLTIEQMKLFGDMHDLHPESDASTSTVTTPPSPINDSSEQTALLANLSSIHSHLNSNPNVRATAAKALGDLSLRPIPHEFFHILVTLLRDPAPDVRRASVNALSRLGPAAISDETTAALTALLRDPDPNIRFSASNAIIDLGPAALSKDSLPALVSLLSSSLSFVRGAALNALRSITMQSSEIGISLIEFLRSPDPSIREGVAQVISNFSSATATSELLSLLCSLLEDPTSGVRDWSALAIEKLGGEELKLEIREHLEKFWRVNLNEKIYSSVFQKNRSEAAYEALHRLSTHHTRDLCKSNSH